MVDIQTISVVIAAASVVVGVITFILNSRTKNKQRQVELMFQRMERDLERVEAWHNVLYVQDWESHSELRRKYPFETKPKERAWFSYIANYYNCLGLLLKEKVIRPDFMFAVYGPASVLTTWKRYELTVKQMRQGANEPMLFEGFEYLANEVKRRYPEVILTPGAREASWGKSSI